nr:enoyl-CoA hydratase-related protein [Hyphomonas sediminis]
MWLTIDRESRANALNPNTIADLRQAFVNPGDVRLVVLTGAGERAFCSGADLAGDAAEETASQFVALLDAMDRCPVPIVARVNGAVAGGGVGLVCASDIAIGVDVVTFATPEARVGLFPFMIFPYLLRVSSPRVVADMAFAGQRLSAVDAVQAGFLTRVVRRSGLDDEVDRLCSEIRSMGPQALLDGRAAFGRHVFASSAADDELMRALINAWSRPESQEGRAAFREKRSPAWIEGSK